MLDCDESIEFILPKDNAATLKIIYSLSTTRIERYLKLSLYVISL